MPREFRPGDSGRTRRGCRFRIIAEINAELPLVVVVTGHDGDETVEQYARDGRYWREPTGWDLTVVEDVTDAAA